MSEKSDNNEPLDSPPHEQLQKACANANADVFLFAADITHETGAEFIQCVSDNAESDNCLLLIETVGGSADAAYRMARCVQEQYHGGRFAIFVREYCKSAGTLLAIGAHEIVMADDSELGPLDMQIIKQDSLVERTSGLTPTQSLQILQQETFRSFESNFLRILEASGHKFTIRTSAAIAARLTAGLFKPIYAQIDPMRLGEFHRSVQVAMEYGKRLDYWSNNLRQRSLARLINGYPSHEFVIDRREASVLFHHVRAPSETESLLSSLVDRLCGDDHEPIRYLNRSNLSEGGAGSP